MKIAMLGTGIMGFPMARRLAEKGLQVSAWNRTKAKAAPLAAYGVRLAPTPADAVAGADVIATCLTDAEALRSVLLARDGILEAAPGVLIMDFSTSSPEATRVLAEAAAARGRSPWIDCPVSGGPSAAASGSLVAFCGGNAADMATVDPVLKALTRRFTHMGPSGSGQGAKLCNQLIVSATMIAISEAVTLAHAFGIDPARLPAALAGGYADSLPLQIFGPRMAAETLEPRISEVATMLKDVREVASEGRQEGLSLRLAETLELIYSTAETKGFGGDDLAILPRLSQPARRPDTSRFADKILSAT
ncbi:NAD(P)-dependent oxidoreductase [Brevundimonas sp.]|uniref:NAD(P)-dependent oxidoreductase n=1 Tax=Brevundimonas sp. TaxID=1871086 RepID=UPI0025BD6EB4|nr:NAD(P)-dependent oxidoreductase [Brevundimonas sp.]